MARQKSLQGVRAEDDFKCPECGNEELVKENGEIYCKKCGFVL
jgi:DNA-directed RNA polymerase subunit RPC12/RpoP